MAYMKKVYVDFININLYHNLIFLSRDISSTFLLYTYFMICNLIEMQVPKDENGPSARNSPHLSCSHRAATVDFWQARTPQLRPLHWCAAAAAAIFYFSKIQPRTKSWLPCLPWQPSHMDQTTVTG